MSKLRSEIECHNAAVTPASSSDQLKRLSEDLLDQIAGGWVNAFGRVGWTRRF